MNENLNLATSLRTNSLTLFIGTGFSKYMTNNIAPSWLELLVECTSVVDNDDKLKNQLFNTDAGGSVKESRYDLTICAQMLEIEFRKKKKTIKETISDIIKARINSHTIDKRKIKELQDFFHKHPNVNIVTTNYDTIFSDYVLPLTSRIIIEGSTIPRINSGQNIYHIHGCVEKPESIILTINDYYNFQNNNNYFSRKFFTLLQETTVAILGYSLGDFNLNSILSEVKNSKNESFRKSDLYYVSRDKVPEIISKFYYLSYGINVISNTEIVDFFEGIESEYDKACELIDSVNILNLVMNGTEKYSNDFLKLKVSLNYILVQAGNMGIESTDEKFINVLIQVLNTKRELTQEDGAWSQYEQLADWLIEIASTVIINNSRFENEFCEIAKYSFNRCSKKLYIGYSWYAYSIWQNRWNEMIIENQIMLQEIIDNGNWSKFTEVAEIYK